MIFGVNLRVNYVELSSDSILREEGVHFMVPLIWTGGIHTVFYLSNAIISLIYIMNFISYYILL